MNQIHSIQGLGFQAKVFCPYSSSSIMCLHTSLISSYCQHSHNPIKIRFLQGEQLNIQNRNPGKLAGNADSWPRSPNHLKLKVCRMLLLSSTHHADTSCRLYTVATFKKQSFLQNSNPNFKASTRNLIQLHSSERKNQFSLNT